MGQQSSLSQNKSIILSNWQEIKAGSNLYFNKVTNQQVQKTEVLIINKAELNSYADRMQHQTNYICQLMYCHSKPNQTIKKPTTNNLYPMSNQNNLRTKSAGGILSSMKKDTNTQYQDNNSQYPSKIYCVYTDRMIPVKEWNKQKVIHVLQGFKKLVKVYGLFKVRENCICQNQRKQIKIWINQNPVSNFVIEVVESEEDMIADLAALLVSKKQKIAKELLDLKDFDYAIDHLILYREPKAAENIRDSNGNSGNNVNNGSTTKGAKETNAKFQSGVNPKPSQVNNYYNVFINTDNSYTVSSMQSSKFSANSKQPKGQFGQNYNSTKVNPPPPSKQSAFESNRNVSKPWVKTQVQNSSKQSKQITTRQQTFGSDKSHIFSNFKSQSTKRTYISHQDMQTGFKQKDLQENTSIMFQTPNQRQTNTNMTQPFLLDNRQNKLTTEGSVPKLITNRSGFNKQVNVQEKKKIQKALRMNQTEWLSRKQANIKSSYKTNPDRTMHIKTQAVTNTANNYNSETSQTKKFERAKYQKNGFSINRQKNSNQTPSSPSSRVPGMHGSKSMSKVIKKGSCPVNSIFNQLAPPPSDLNRNVVSQVSPINISASVINTNHKSTLNNNYYAASNYKANPVEKSQSKYTQKSVTDEKQKFKNVHIETYLKKKQAGNYTPVNELVVENPYESVKHEDQIAQSRGISYYARQNTKQFDYLDLPQEQRRKFPSTYSYKKKLQKADSNQQACKSGTQVKRKNGTQTGGDKTSQVFVRFDDQDKTILKKSNNSCFDNIQPVNGMTGSYFSQYHNPIKIVQDYDKKSKTNQFKGDQNNNEAQSIAERDIHLSYPSSNPVPRKKDKQYTFQQNKGNPTNQGNTVDKNIQIEREPQLSKTTYGNKDITMNKKQQQSKLKNKTSHNVDKNSNQTRQFNELEQLHRSDPGQISEKTNNYLKNIPTIQDKTKGGYTKFKKWEPPVNVYASLIGGKSSNDTKFKSEGMKFKNQKFSTAEKKQQPIQKQAQVIQQEKEKKQSQNEPESPTKIQFQKKVKIRQQVQFQFKSLFGDDIATSKQEEQRVQKQKVIQKQKADKKKQQKIRLQEEQQMLDNSSKDIFIQQKVEMQKKKHAQLKSDFSKLFGQ